MGQSTAAQRDPISLRSMARDAPPLDTVHVPESCLAAEVDGTRYVLGSICHVEAMMLVDTGSAVTLMSRKFYDTLCTHADIPLFPVATALRSVSDTPLSVLGEATLPLQLGGVSAVHKVIVADIAPDLLLGIDFFQTNSCTIDFAQKIIIAGGLKVPLRALSCKRHAVCRVSLDVSVTVPAYSQIIVPGKLETEGKMSDSGWIQPVDSFLSKHTLGMAGVLATPDESGCVPIRLQNFLPHPTSVPKNTYVGMYDPDVSVDEDSPSDSDSDLNSTSMCNNVNSSSSAPHATFDLNHIAETDLPSISTLLDSNADVVSTSPTDLGTTNVVQHSIETATERPLRQPPRRIPLHQRAEVRAHIQQLLSANIISPSCSPWAAPIVIVRKPDGSIRLCVDYRQLNSVTRKDAFPLPRVDDAIDAMTGSCYFSTLDLASGYWQVELDNSAKSKSAFVTPFGLYEWNRMPFGLCNAPSTFQRLMNQVLCDLVPEICLVYLDDIIIFSSTLEQHIHHLELVFQKLRQAGLKIKPQKCHLLCSSVKYLGFTFSAAGVSPDESKFKTVRDWPIPQSVSDVRSFVGFATYYQRFIPNFAELAVPLNKLSEKYALFQWSKECQEAFDDLKHQLISAPILAYPDPSRQFTLDTDASNVAMGAVLSQLDDMGQEVVIAYASKTLSKSQRNQGATKKELLAVVTFTKHFKHYLLGSQFRLRTDHRALIWLHSFREADGVLARWIERLAAFDYTIIHRPGKQHTNADALSRLQPGQPEQTPECSETVATVQQSAAATNSNWCEPFSLLDLQQAQSQDADITIMIGWQQALLDRPRRSDIALRGASLRLLRLWSQWNRLCLIDNVLYRQYTSDDPNSSGDRQLVLPESLQPRVLKAAHADVSGGHLGIERTLEKLRKRYYWPFMTSDVTKFCKACEVCESRKAPVPTPRAPLVQDSASFPLERVAIDIMGPLPESRRGNRYIVVVCDYFTKWCEAFPVPNIQAETVATVLVDGFFCRYGVSYHLHSDRGAQFESNLFQQLCKMLDVHKTRTTAYHPQSDGLVERMNRTLENLLAAHVNDYHNDWDEHLQRCLLAYRSSVHSSTRETPAMLMFGRELQLPVDLMFASPIQPASTVKEYVPKLMLSLKTAYDHARAAGITAQKRQKAVYDKKVTKPSFAAGDQVFLHVPVVKPGTTPKFHRPYKGPYSVIKVIDDVVVQIMDKSGQLQTVHVDRLKKTTACNPSLVGQPGEPQPEPTFHRSETPNYQPTVVLLDANAQTPAPIPVVHRYDLRNRRNNVLPARYRDVL